MIKKTRRAIVDLLLINVIILIPSPFVFSSAATPDVRVKGRVLDARTRKPVAGAMIFVRRWHGLASAEGRFHIDLPPGQWTLETVATQYQASSISVDVRADVALDVEILLIPARFIEEHVDVTANVNGGSNVIATTPVRPIEVLNVAGAFENVFRVLHTMPGVTATDEIGSRMSVRGGGPDQNMTVMDGVEIHNPYRLWGLVSAFNPETVESFELSTGAFSAKYGDRLSSILTIENRAGRTNSLMTGSVGLSLTDGNGIIEGRLPKNAGSWLLTGRRTWYDVIAERFTDDDLPSFDDFQGKVAFDLGQGRSFTLSGLRSLETSDFTFTDDFDEGAQKTKTRNNVASAALFLPVGRLGSSRTIAAAYENADDIDLDVRFRDEMRRSNAPYDDTAFSYNDIVGFLKRGVRDYSLRQELVFRVSNRQTLETGFETRRLETRENLRIDVKNRPEMGLWSSHLAVDDAHDYERSGAWLVDRIHAARWLDIEAGLRFDASSINGRKELTPRLSATTHLSEKTRLRTAYGLHTQSPGYEKLAQADYFLDFSKDGKLDIENERAHHVIVGLERDLAPGFMARLEGFYKRFDKLIIGRLETPEETRERVAAYDFPVDLQGDIPSRSMITNFPTNDGRGRAYGFDLFLVRRAVSSETRLTGWLAYTYTSANRRSYGQTYSFDYEQPHALSLVANFRAHQRLELSMTGRITSGFPATPPLGLYVSGAGDTNDFDGDGIESEIVPERDDEGRLVWGVDYGSIANINRSRRPAYARIDLRATFVPRWGKGRWRLYVDALNVLNRKNGPVIEELAYDPDSDRPRITEKRETTIPFIPSFGIHVRF
ncbi:MAG: TonB-dependent receptor plug domain-containing protein [Vicinamibacteria bacterium]|nr:TonB-dependent receptor plug domain-containing protein [Vicinamibacteria bacterium]